MGEAPPGCEPPSDLPIQPSQRGVDIARRRPTSVKEAGFGKYVPWNGVRFCSEVYRDEFSEELRDAPSCEGA